MSMQGRQPGGTGFPACVLRARQDGSRQAGKPVTGGFTLIELLLALGLFTVSIAMVACLFPAAIFQAKIADEHTMAAIISQNAIATIRPIGIIRIPE